METFSLKTGLVCLALLASDVGAHSEEITLVVANTNVPVNEISSEALKDIYTGRTAYWANGQKVVIVVLAAQEDDALNSVSGMGLSQFKTFWRRMVFSGRGQEPKQAATAAELVAQVAASKGAIALLPKAQAPKGLKTLKVIGGSAPVSEPKKENGAMAPATP